MHFLCLHGIGTNSKIFQLQTAPIRDLLGDNHTYEFVDGSLLHAPDPVFASLTANDDEFFSYLDIESAKSCSKALDDLDSFIDAEGPFDAVMAFSQGAGLAATLMLRHSRQNSASPFKLAIFFSGGVPADPELLAEGIVRRLDPDVEGEVIHTPTAHIYGSNDHRLESDSQNLSRLCSVTNKTVQIHNGGHEIPGLKVREAVPAIVRAIKKVMEKTLSY